MCMAPESRITKIPLDCHNLAEELPQGNIMVVGYEPSVGEYNGHSYLLRYISPVNGTKIVMKSIQGKSPEIKHFGGESSHIPPVCSLYTKIIDISGGDDTRDVQPMTKEFRDVFIEAIEKGKGYIVAKDDIPIENFEEML